MIVLSFLQPAKMLRNFEINLLTWFLQPGIQNLVLISFVLRVASPSKVETWASEKTSLANSSPLRISLGYLVSSRRSACACRPPTHDNFSWSKGKCLLSLLCGFTCGLVSRVLIAASLKLCCSWLSKNSNASCRSVGARNVRKKLFRCFYIC